MAGVSRLAKIFTPQVSPRSVHQMVLTLERRLHPTASTPHSSNIATPSPSRVKWMFTTEKACAKMGHAYPRSQEVGSH
jgi:hypothetical protein